VFNENLDLFISFLESSNKRKLTINQYKRELEMFFNFLEEKGLSSISEVETIHIDTYQAKIMRQNKTASVAKRISVLRSFFKYMHSRKYISENPISALDRVKIKDVDRKKKENLSIEEAIKLINSTEKNSIPTMKLRNKVLMMAFLFFGLRVSELCNLKVENISFKNKTVYIVDGKGGKNREVPLFDELIPTFKEYLKTKKVKTDYLFTTKNTKKPLHPRSVLDLVKRHVVKAKIKKNIGCHSLRRTSATLLLEDGFDPRKIQMYLGHTSINTTMLYLNPDVEDTKNQIRKGFSLAKKLKKKSQDKK
jgi:integrase/recombinase XerD